MGTAGTKLKEGSLDVALFVSPTQNPFLLDLFSDPRVRLLGFERQTAYCQRFPFLTPVKLAEGVVDLERDIPDRDVPLLAPAALLICRKACIRAAIEQILNAAQAIHAPTGLVDAEHRFPSLKEVDVPIHEVSERFMRTGESFLSRLLPYWGLWLFYEVQVLILPVLMVWIPFLRILPAVYSFRINRLLRHHYVALREVENAMERTESPAKVRRNYRSWNISAPKWPRSLAKCPDIYSAMSITGASMSRWCAMKRWPGSRKWRRQLPRRRLPKSRSGRAGGVNPLIDSEQGVYTPRSPIVSASYFSFSLKTFFILSSSGRMTSWQ